MKNAPMRTHIMGAHHEEAFELERKKMKEE